MKLTGGRRITTEDFKQDEKSMARKLAFIINPFMEQVRNGFEKNLTIADNLNQFYKDVTVEVDGSGVVLNTASFSSTIGNINGIHVVNHFKADNGADFFPSSGLYCTHQQENNIITIQHVTGLPANRKVTLRLLILGD